MATILDFVDREREVSQRRESNDQVRRLVPKKAVVVMKLQSHRVSLRSMLHPLNIRRSSINVLSHLLDIILQPAVRVLDLERPNTLSEDLIHLFECLALRLREEKEAGSGQPYGCETNQRLSSLTHGSTTRH